MSYYIHLSSDACLDVYNDNTGNAFKNRLSRPLSLTGDWSVAVTELEIRPMTKGYICVCIDIVSPSHVGGNQLPLARRIYPHLTASNNIYLYTRPYYIPLTNKFIEDIGVYLTDDAGVRTSFTSEALRLTVHIRRDSPFQES